MYDLILAEGLVYDGLGNPAKRIDIAVKNGKIAALGDLAPHFHSTNTIYLADCIISPGFIDIHSHSDVYYLADPQAECKIRQGVTTEVTGNCGVSAAPLYGDFRRKRVKDWNSLGINIKWKTFRNYIDILENQGIGLNVVPLAGHGNIRGAVKGYDKGMLLKTERKKMSGLLAKCLEQGAWGLSTGLIYSPSMHAGTRELVELNKIVVEFGGIYTTHIRGEGDNLLGAVREAVGIARQSGVSLQISHLKTGSPGVWNKLPLVFKIIENGIKDGLKINCDRYPYIASNTDLDVILPDWFNNIKETEKKKKLADYREKLEKFLNNDLESAWPNWADHVYIGRVGSKKNRYVCGMNIKKIAKKRKQSPGQIVISLLEEEDLEIQAMFFCMREDNLIKILKKPYVIIGSDSSLRTIKGPLAVGHPHPRVFGTFPRVFSVYLTKLGLPMEEIIRKMTGLPAQKIGLKDRGVMREGAWADLCVFNPKKVKDKATYEKPFQYSEGMKYVLVNGEFVIKNSRCTGKLPGKVLLRT